jgi:hypothetical protein
MKMKLMFAILLLFTAQARAETCVTTLEGFKKLIKQENFPVVWAETTADDGKPLIMRISTEKDRLHLEFDKTKEGIWAKGFATICQDKKRFSAKIAKEDVQWGPEAPFVMKMGGSANFKLEFPKQNKMNVAVFGWSGTFVPQAP